MYPRLFSLGGFTLHTYGVLVVAGFAAGLWMAVRLARKQNLNTDRVFDLCVYCLMGAVAGAKLLLLLSDWRYYREHPTAVFSLDFLQAFGVFYGGFLGATAAAAWFMRRQRMPFFETADLLVPGLVLGHAIGRTGCFFAGCCWGRPATLPWAVTFRDPYAHDTVGVPLGVDLHPAQLYEVAALVGLFLIVMAVWRKRLFPGQVLGAYLALYGAARFALEFTRDHSASFALGHLSLSQLIALILLPMGIWVLWARPGRAALPDSAGAR